MEVVQFYLIVSKFTNTANFFLLRVSISEDGTYAMKKVLIQSKDQLDLVREEIRVSPQPVAAS